MALSDNLECAIGQTNSRLFVYSHKLNLISVILCNLKPKRLEFVSDNRIVAGSGSSVCLYSFEGELIFNASTRNWFINHCQLNVICNDSVYIVDESLNTVSVSSSSLHDYTLSYLFALQTQGGAKLLCCSNPQLKLHTDVSPLSSSPFEHLNNIKVSSIPRPRVFVCDRNFKEEFSIEIQEIPEVDIAAYDDKLRLLAVTSFTFGTVRLFVNKLSLYSSLV